MHIALRHLLVSTALGCLVHAIPAFADQGQAPQAANKTPSNQPPSGLQDIIVTARKKQENIQNIPVAADIMSSDKINNFAVVSVEAISSLAPQLIIGRAGAGNGASIGMRGVSVPNTSISLEQSVATVIDGVYISGGHAINEGLFDIARIEVLKGPQSLFYGKNTTAGAISVYTADPTHTLEAGVKASYEFNAVNPALEGYVSAPLSDTLSLRVAGRFSDQYGSLFSNYSVAHTDSTYDIATGTTTARAVPAATDQFPGDRTYIGRATLLYEPTSNFTAKLKITYDNFHNSSPASTLVTYYCPNGGISQNDPSLPCGKNFIVSQNPMAAAEAATNPLLNKHGGNDYQDYNSINATGDITYKADKFTLNVVPGYVRWINGFMGDFDFTPTFDSPNGQGSHSAERSIMSAFSLETRLESKFSGPLNVMVGGYFQSQHLGFKQAVIFPDGPANSAAADPAMEFVTVDKASFADGKTYAAFGEAIWDITSQLNLTAGARYTHEDKNSNFAQDYVNPAYAAVFLPTSIGAQQSFNNVSPEATLTYKPAHQITTYLSYKTGYKSGGFDISGLITPGTTAQNASYLPEKVHGFEGGIKSTLDQNQLRVNFDLFWFTYTDEQINFLDAAALRYFTLNAAALRTRGAELQIEYAPRAVPGLTVNASAAYTDAVYTSFPFAPCLTGQSIQDGCTVGPTDTIVRAYQDLSGHRPAQAPEFTADVQAEQRIQTSSDYEIGLTGNVRFSSSYYANGFASLAGPEYKQDAFATVDLGARFGPKTRKWEIGVLVKNLTNHFIITDAQAVPFNGGGEGTPAASRPDVYGAISDPRTIEAHFSVKF